MILITGGAGFIGSNLHASLIYRDLETVIVDRLGSGEKWRNISKHPPARLIHPEDFEDFLNKRPDITTIFHLGARSETISTDADLVWKTNVELSLKLYNWCIKNKVRFIYASSASTYGDGSQGFNDDDSILRNLQPLNLYGWSKHAFDLEISKKLNTSNIPPQCIGLKFFNVYGPNEYHKGKMISVVKVKYDEVLRGDRPKLFRSKHPNILDGEQKRDFIWISDVVDVMLWLLDNPRINGIYNVGTGIARSYRDLVSAVCSSVGIKDEVDFIDIPENLSKQYQYFTEANMSKLRSVGYNKEFTSLEDGINTYIKDYLITGNLYS